MSSSPAFRPRDAAALDRAALAPTSADLSAALKGKVTSFLSAAVTGVLTFNALPAFLTAASAAGGETVFVPVGQHRLDGTLTSANPLVLVGHNPMTGPGTVSNSRSSQIVANFASGDVVSVTSLYSSRFENLQFNSNVGPRTSGAALAINGPGAGQNNATSRVVNCGFNGYYTCISLADVSACRVRESYFQAWTYAAIYASSSDTVEDGAGWITHNYIFGDSTPGTQQKYGYCGRSGYVKITENLFVGSQIAIQLLFDQLEAGAPEVRANWIENFDVCGINVANGNGYACSMLKLNDNELFNDIDRPNCLSYISLTAGAAIWLRNVQVCGNTLRGFVHGTGGFLDLQTGSGMLVANNRLEGSTGNTSAGIVVGAQARSVVIQGNLLKGFAQPYVLTTECLLTDLGSGLTVAQAPTCKDGSLVYFADANPALATLTGGSTGALATRRGGAWCVVVVQAPWLTYTPTLAANNGALTTRGVSASSYIVEGKRVTLSIDETVTTDGTSGAAYLVLGLPSGIVPKSRGRFYGYDASGNITLVFFLNGGSGTINIFRMPTGTSVAYPGANGAAIVGTLTFQIQ